ncbi:MAG: hypothetical protein ACRDMI_18620, partial [Streptosporangiaceae bacterium]
APAHAESGIMSVIEDHYALRADITPDHVGDRARAIAVTGPEVFPGLISVAVLNLATSSAGTRPRSFTSMLCAFTDLGGVQPLAGPWRWLRPVVGTAAGPSGSPRMVR